MFRAITASLVLSVTVVLAGCAADTEPTPEPTAPSPESSEPAPAAETGGVDLAIGCPKPKPRPPSCVNWLCERGANGCVICACKDGI